jgi:hypothetical protein
MYGGVAGTAAGGTSGPISANFRDRRRERAVRQREREAAAMQPSDMWVPQRQEAGCPPVDQMPWAERLVLVCFVLMLVVAGSHLVLIGPVALLPALSGTFGIVAVMRGIRGLRVVANVVAACFSLMYLVLALVTFPEIQAICTHLEANRQGCHQCALQSTIEQCHGEVDSQFGPRCYAVETGASCLEKRGQDDECQVAAMRSQPQPRCYCVHDIWDPHWQVTCDDLRGYSDNYIENKALGFFLLCCVGTLAGINVGCCDRNRFGRKMSFSHGQGAARARRVGVGGELRSDLVGGEGATDHTVMPLQVVDGVADAALHLQLHGHRDTPIGWSSEPVDRGAAVGDGAVGTAGQPIALTGVVVQQHEASSRSDGSARSPPPSRIAVEGTLVSPPRPLPAAAVGAGAAAAAAGRRGVPVPTQRVKAFRVVAAQEEQDDDDGDGQWTEL